MNHIIKVSFVKIADEERVKADPNPSPGNGNTIKLGDKVIWFFDPATVGGRDLQVVFQKVIDLTVPPGPSAEQPCNPYGPCEGLKRIVSGIKGEFRLDIPQDQLKNKRFVYKMFEKGEPLKWAEIVPGGDEFAGGGIDIPMTPPPPRPPAE